MKKEKGSFMLINFIRHRRCDASERYGRGH